MPNNWDRDSQTDEIATSFVKENSFKGRGHDRIRVHGDNPLPAESATIAMSGDNEDVDMDITQTQKMISAMSGSLLTSLLVTPLDVVRVRLQSQPNPSPLSNLRGTTVPSLKALNTIPPNLGVTACCREVFFGTNNGEYCLAGPNQAAVGAECAVEETQRRTFNSTFDGLKKIARNEGFTTLWRGLSPTLVMTIPGNIIYFTGYDYLRFNKLSPINRVFSDNYSPVVSGGVARIAAAVVVSPIEMFRTRIQASQKTGGGHFAETAKGVTDMVASHGYTSLWRGLTLTLWRDVPFSAIYWWGYETIRGQLTEARERGRGRDLKSEDSRNRARARSQSRENHSATFTDSFIGGAVSGAVASFVTMPFDVGKTKRQIFVDPGTKTGVERALAPEERSMPRFLWHIYQTEGISGLWNGWIPRTLKVAPACAIMISSYEVGKRAFRGTNERAERKRNSI